MREACFFLSGASPHSAPKAVNGWHHVPQDTGSRAATAQRYPGHPVSEDPWRCDGFIRKIVRIAETPFTRKVRATRDRMRSYRASMTDRFILPRSGSKDVFSRTRVRPRWIPKDETR